MGIRKRIIILLFLFFSITKVSASSVWENVPEANKENAKHFYLALVEEGIPPAAASAMTARGYSESGFDPYRLESYGGVGGSGWELRHQAGYEHVPPAYGFLQMQGRKPGDRLAKMLAKVESYKGGAGTTDPKIASEAQAKAHVDEFKETDPFKTYRVGPSPDGYVQNYGNGLVYEIPAAEVGLTEMVDSFEKFKQLSPRAGIVVWTVGIVRPSQKAFERDWKIKDIPMVDAIAEEFAGLNPYSLGTGFEDKSLLQEHLTPAAIMDKNGGFFFDPLGTLNTEAKKIALKLQNSILDKKETEEKYSLYQRFGGDIHFYRYLGEATQSIQLLDHVYSAFTSDQIDSLKITDIFYKSPIYLSNNVYKGRPKVLTRENISEGLVDPRVTTLTSDIFGGYAFNAAEFNLAFSKFFVGLTTAVMDGSVINLIKDVMLKILDLDFFTRVVSPVIMFFTSLAMIFFILSLGKFGREYATGRVGFKQIFKRFYVGVISLILIFTFSAYPSKFVELSANVLVGIDSFFNQVINTSFKDDDVINSSSGVKATEAALWKTTIFEPWVRGVFLDDYENLGTQFSEGNKYQQSNATSEQINSQPDGKYLFNSANLTGDVSVPLGNGTYVKNWAAYLYSVQSDNHLDFEISSMTSTTTEEKSSARIVSPKSIGQEAKDWIKNLSYTYIGDSLGVGSEPLLKAVSPRANFNVLTSRFLKTTGNLDALTTLREMSSRGEIKETLVVALGTNGGSRNITKENLELFYSEIPSHVKNIVWINSRQTSDDSQIEVSRTIKDFAKSKNGRMHVLDWLSAADSWKWKENVTPDGYHQTNYSNYVDFQIQGLYDVLSKSSNGSVLEVSRNEVRPLTTYKNDKLKADFFRVIDAQMDISPQMYKDGLIVENYTGSRPIKNNIYGESFNMLRNSIILALFFLPLIYQKLKFTILFLSSLVLIGINGIRELYREGSGVGNISSDILENLVGFTVTTFKLFILTMLYTTLIGKGLLEFVVFIFIALTLYNMSYKAIKRQVRDLPNKFNRVRSLVKGRK